MEADRNLQLDFSLMTVTNEPLELGYKILYGCNSYLCRNSAYNLSCTLTITNKAMINLT